MFTLIAAVFGLICFLSTLVIVIDAFKNSVLKGVLCIFCCGLYYIYYALFEFQHPNKFLIVLCSFLGGGIAGAIRFLRL